MLTCRYRLDFTHTCWILTNHRSPSEDGTVFRKLCSPVCYKSKTFFHRFPRISHTRGLQCFCVLSVYYHPRILSWACLVFQAIQGENILVVWRITVLWMQNNLGEQIICIVSLSLLLFSKVRDVQSFQAEFQQGMQHQYCSKIPAMGMLRCWVITLLVAPEEAVPAMPGLRCESYGPLSLQAWKKGYEFSNFLVQF